MKLLWYDSTIDPQSATGMSRGGRAVLTWAFQDRLFVLAVAPRTPDDRVAADGSLRGAAGRRLILDVRRYESVRGRVQDECLGGRRASPVPAPEPLAAIPTLDDEAGGGLPLQRLDPLPAVTAALAATGCNLQHE